METANTVFGSQHQSLQVPMSSAHAVTLSNLVVRNLVRP